MPDLLPHIRQPGLCWPAFRHFQPHSLPPRSCHDDVDGWPFCHAGAQDQIIDTGKNDLLYLMIDGTERPVQRPGTPSRRKASYSGKKKRHTASHQIITDDSKRIQAVGPAQPGRKHDKRIYDEAHVDKPPMCSSLAISVISERRWKSRSKPQRTIPKEQKTCNRWHAKLRIGVEHGICRMEKFRILADTHRNNGQADMIAKNVAALANLNLKTARPNGEGYLRSKIIALIVNRVYYYS